MGYQVIKNNIPEKLTSTYMQKKKEQPQMKKIINNAHKQLHQVQTKISSFYDDVLYILLLYRFALNVFPN